MSFQTPLSTGTAPLTFDRVADGVPVTSKALLFQFPIELIPHITENLSRGDLAALSQVDVDCRQLARSIQFANLVFDFSKPGAWELLNLLESERSSIHSDTTSWPLRRRLGPCIRHVGLKACLQSERVSMGGLMSRLATICADALPNLYVLDFHTPFQPAPTPSTQLPLRGSSARHVRLDASWAALIPVCHAAWEVETLVIDISETPESPAPSHTFLIDILQATRTALQTLELKNTGPAIAIPHEVLAILLTSLPQLRQLRLEGFKLDVSPLSPPLPPPPASYQIAEISLVDCHCNIYEYLGAAGTVGSLRSIRVKPSSSHDLEYVLGFLENNSHILALDIAECHISGVSPRTRLPLLPLLQHHFKDLVALRLIWESFNTIPFDALSTLSCMHALETLWLSAGSQNGWPTADSHFLIDHDAILSVAKALPRLKNLIFTRDTYPTQSHTLLDPSLSNPSRYYINRHLPQNILPEDFLSVEEATIVCGNVTLFDFDTSRRQWREMECLAWERWHVVQMKYVAKRYFEEVKALGFVYVGMVPVYRAGGVVDNVGLDFGGHAACGAWDGVLSRL